MIVRNIGTAAMGGFPTTTGHTAPVQCNGREYCPLGPGLIRYRYQYTEAWGLVPKVHCWWADLLQLNTGSHCFCSILLPSAAAPCQLRLWC